MPPAAEQIETERLLLRQFTEADFDAYARMHADPEVVRFLGGQTWSRPDAWRHFASSVGHWGLRGFGPYAVIEKASDQFAGRVGFNQPAGWPGFELGWTLVREHWGKGLATEAAAACLEQAFTVMGRPRVISLIHPENRPSRRIAERIGERRTGHSSVPGFEGSVELWAVSAEEWQAR